MSLTQLLSDASIPYAVDEPMVRHTTFRIGGPADLCVRPRDRRELITALEIWRTGGEGCPLYLVGNGSNLLVSDKGLRGMVVLTGDVREVTFDGETVTAGCGASLTALAAACLQEGLCLGGLEFAYGIPGTVGGAVVMNAGAYGGEMAQVVVRSEYYDLSDGRVKQIEGGAHEFAYRHSVYQEHPTWVILSATLTLRPGDPEVIRAAMETNMTSRKEKQPLNLPSAGSVFKRPAQPGVYVGKMVEACGLKGYRIGGAAVSEKHAGFIVNVGGATAADVTALIAHVQTTVANAYGYELECEVRLVGE